MTPWLVALGAAVVVLVAGLWWRSARRLRAREAVRHSAGPDRGPVR